MSEDDIGLNVRKLDQKMSVADIRLVTDNVSLRRRAPWPTSAANIRHLVDHAALLPH